MSKTIDNSLDPSGTCYKCKKGAQTEFLECSICHIKVHVINCEDVPNLCTSTFLQGYPTMEKNYPCITFTCAPCLNRMKLSNDEILSDRLSQVETFMQSVTTDISQLKAMLSNKAHEAFSGILLSDNSRTTQKMKHIQ